MKEFKKDEIENLSYKDITYKILEGEKKGINTLDLFTKIVNLLELPASIITNKIGDYYTSLTTDMRFVLIDGVWDLRNRHKSDKVMVDMTLDEEDDTLDENKDEDNVALDEYEDDYTDDIDMNSDYDDTDDEDLSDLVVLDEEDLSE